MKRLLVILFDVARDIGCAYLVAAFGLACLGLAAARARAKRFARAEDDRRPRSFVGWLAKSKLDAYERDFGYDTTYLRRVADVSPGGFFKYSLFTIFAGHRDALPVEALYVTKLTTVMREDCGSCSQLVVRMAEGEGVSAKTLRAVLARDAESMSPDARLVFELTNAILDRDVLAADPLREEARQRWGDEAIVTLSFAIASTRVYPTVKYALGYGKACSRIRVEGEDAPLARA